MEPKATELSYSHQITKFHKETLNMIENFFEYFNVRFCINLQVNYKYRYFNG